MNVLIIGAGGREHALAWAIARSPLLGELYGAPGNGGIATVGDCVTLDDADHRAVVEFCEAHDIGLVVIGPEAPLVAGLGDTLTDAGIRAFGPSAKAALLEGSKGFTKDLCARHGIPTAGYRRFSSRAEAEDYVREQGLPLVLKADGLAAGKGVIIVTTMEQATDGLAHLFGGAFGAAGQVVIVEEFLDGEEASFFALVDGETALPLATAQDHKRVGDGDTGPNTGGMGAYSPAPVMTDEMCARTMAEIIEPTIRAMSAAGTPYRGVLFAGLMITDAGPKLIEYNARFGDPECQVLMMRLKSDLLGALIATADGNLDQLTLDWSADAALTVVMAANGYPGAYDKGSTISGLDKAAAPGYIEIFHAGTTRSDGRVIATGGRVLNVTARGRTVAEAQARAYRAVDMIDWPEGFCRRDIGWRAVERENNSG